ncbi:hypothetical protein CS379_21780, partial [Methylobacterium frigidaeris]
MCRRPGPPLARHAAGRRQDVGLLLRGQSRVAQSAARHHHDGDGRGLAGLRYPRGVRAGHH